MIFWSAANVLFSCAACWGLVYLLVRHGHRMHAIDRGAVAVLAGCMLLRCGPIIGKGMAVRSPFDDWSVGLTSLSVAVLALRLAWRLEDAWHHRRKGY